MSIHRYPRLELSIVDGIPEGLGDTREFHVSAAARDRYRFQEGFFSVTGNVVFADFDAARRFADAMNRERDLLNHPEYAARAGDLNAMGIIDEVLHHLVSVYTESAGGDLFTQALSYLRERYGHEAVDGLLERFVTDFPPRSVRAGEKSSREFLDSEVDGASGWERAAEELLLLRLENENPAYQPYGELFEDEDLERETSYEEVVEGLEEFFAGKQAFGPEGLTLMELLRAPARSHPDSLEGQLSYIRERWGGFIGAHLMRLLRSMDLIREERKATFGGPGPQRPYEFGAEEELERFSPDRDWMPNVVLLAKSTLVWLDQLSRFYGTEIRRLDQVPNEELDRIARRGFNSLWLIGIWRRSRASKQIKRMCGNPEAEASAYSLLEYEISEDLGGWPALEDLRRRCNERGIHLASDMVPNHTAIDSTWVYDHPDRFVQLDHSPFPGYTFDGPNLSQRPGIGIYLEDHYYDRSDAAVVFKRVDYESGNVRYIYHGNDGTSMPWNDTAQLDFLNPDTREAVIQSILHVARNFRVIRFDAAMILAKRHFERLWYPEPGAGGDIASRAEHGMSAEEFNRRLPVEFWREVVDRCAEEAPNTLLLAEAFWMMEGYFVRTLGMHRVYNSAFMNMLKEEENAKYRQTIKNTIEFDKEILKRFVNFMNNPDEETAVAQFGKGDKYFGIATLMITMPGLPMFGHGQVEGFAEKYGMEYSRAYWDEQPDEELIRRHEREIFPLMRRRWAFSGVENFLLFDLYGEDGRVNENVFAYANRVGRERTLVLYNNAFERAAGWIRESAGFVEKMADGSREFRRDTLAAALDLTDDHRRFCLLYEQRSGLWYLRNSREVTEQGLPVVLDGYAAQVYLDIYEVEDNEYGHYARLADTLRGAGVPDIDRAVTEVALAPLHESFAAVANSRVLADLAAELAGTEPTEPVNAVELARRYRGFAAQAAVYVGTGDARGGAAKSRAVGRGAAGRGAAESRAAGTLAGGSDQATGPGPSGAGAGADADEAARAFARAVSALRAVGRLEDHSPARDKKRYVAAARVLREGLTHTQSGLGTAFALALCKPLRYVLPRPAKEAGGDRGVHKTQGTQGTYPDGELRRRLAAGVEEWLLLDRLESVLPTGAPEEDHREEWRRRTHLVLAYGGWYSESNAPTARGVMERLLSDADVGGYLGVNRHGGVVWFNKERYDILTYWLFAAAVLEALEPPEPKSSEPKSAVEKPGTQERRTLEEVEPEATEVAGPSPREAARTLLALYEYYETWRSAGAASEYKVESLLSALP
ncbi:MAG: alpha-amylase family glycosyl hydrolase [Spirochaetaceae bacterium]